MKGVSQILSHSTFLVIGIIAMGMVVASVSDYLFDTEERLTRLELNYIANNIKSNLLKVYSLANSSSEYVTGNFQIPVAEKLGNRKIYLEINETVLRMILNLENKEIEIIRDLNIDANLTGRTYLPASFDLEKINGEINIRLIE